MLEIDQHKIPAFLRIKELKRKEEKKMLLLTALDRKEAGVTKKVNNPKPLATALDRKKAGLLRVKKAKWTFAEKVEFLGSIKPRHPEPEEQNQEAPAQEKGEGEEREIEKTKMKVKKMKIKERKVIKEKGFSKKIKSKLKFKEAGTLTHYFDKIKVGVIKVKAPIKEGDEIKIGDFKQIVTSMQIDRKPVKKAKKGDDIGLKLNFTPTIGERVYKIQG